MFNIHKVVLHTITVDIYKIELSINLTKIAIFVEEKNETELIEMRL